MKKAPLVLWMSGGPGCSSLLASMMENGPCRVSRDPVTGSPQARSNPYAWNDRANMLWVDQPAEVGFSYGDTHNSSMSAHDQVASNMLAFLHRWEERFPDSHNGELYIFAESFGGHYAPAVARRYYDAQRDNLAPKNLVLKGVGVGNGLTNPKIQYRYAPEFAYKNTYGVKAVTEEVYEKMVAAVPFCLEKIDACNADGGSHAKCLEAFEYCNNELEVPYIASGRNIYDVRTTVKNDDDMKCVGDFVNQMSVREALDAVNPTHSNPTFQACNTAVYLRFLDDWSREYESSIPAMLEGGVDILIYAGDADFVCNW